MKNKRSRRVSIPSDTLVAFADSVRNALYVLVEVINENVGAPDETPAYLDKYLDAVDQSVARLEVKPSVLRAYASDIRKHGKPLDSGLPGVLERAADFIEANERSQP